MSTSSYWRRVEWHTNAIAVSIAMERHVVNVVESSETSQGCLRVAMRQINHGRGDESTVCCRMNTDARGSQLEVLLYATLLERSIKVDGRQDDIDVSSDVLGEVVLITSYQ
jgi:hypothetical protein